MKYLMVPLTHLVPAEQQRGGQKSYDEKVAHILLDARHGQIPSWATSFVDVAKMARIVDVPSCPLCGSDLNVLSEHPGHLACSGCEHVQGDDSLPVILHRADIMGAIAAGVQEAAETGYSIHKELDVAAAVLRSLKGNGLKVVKA